MEIDTIGIDLGKTIFHVVALSTAGEVVVRRKFSRPQLLRFTSNLRVRLIGMESCGGSHFLGRTLREQGHEVRPMPAQYVKPYVKTNKNDYVDAEAIAEAVGRANMRFVPIKSDEQLDMQSLHRVRDRWVARRTSVINQIRGLLLERGITFRKGRRHAEASLPAVLEDGDNRLSGALRMLLTQLQSELRQLQDQIDEADALIAKAARKQEACQRLMAIPGIGPLTATAVVASIKDRIHLRRPTRYLHFSLARRRRTIHSGWPTNVQNIRKRFAEESKAPQAAVESMPNRGERHLLWTEFNDSQKPAKKAAWSENVLLLLLLGRCGALVSLRPLGVAERLCHWYLFTRRGRD